MLLEEEQVKKWVREALVEMLQDHRSEFYALVREAIEDVALGRAIQKGLQGDYLPEEEIKALIGERVGDGSEI